MDPTKPSHVNNSGGHESQMEDGSTEAQDTVDGETPRDPEGREPDVGEWMTAAAEISNHHRGSADKHRFNTVGHQRRTRQKVVTDFATVNKGTSAGGKPRAALRQALFNQGGSDKSPSSEERGQLDALKQALQAYAVPVSLKWSWKEESQGTVLEKNWTDLVQAHSTLAKTQRHQQEALWEFVYTELTYINKLMIVNDLVIAALTNLHQHGFLLEVTPEQLFSNLPCILSAHQLFWQEVIYPMLQWVRRTGRPFDPLMLEAGCLQFQQRFVSYKHYCWEEDNNLEFSRRQMENNPHFQTYVQWVETHPRCDRMRLGDMQAKPHQRITKYPLLLKAVLRSTQEPSAQKTLRGMLSSVNGFLVSINEYLRLKDEELALSISAQRVEGYEVEGISDEIDKHVKEICQFDLTCPIGGVGSSVVRKLLQEGNLKLRGRKDNKLEVVALLFTDVLLITKAQKKGERLKVVRPPLALDRTHCKSLKDGCSFVLVEVGELHCAMTVYTFTASTSESCSTWMSTIQDAKETLKTLRETEVMRQRETWQIWQSEAQVAREEAKEDSETDSLTESEMLSLEVTGVNGDNNGSAFPQAVNSKQRAGHRKLEGNQMEEEEEMVESQETNELKQGFNHRASGADNIIPYNTADWLRNNPAGPQIILVEDLPDVDYPTNEEHLQSSHQPAPSGEKLELQQPFARRRNSDSVSMSQDSRRNSTYSEPGYMQTFNETRASSKNLVPVSPLQAQTSYQGSSETSAASHHSFNNGSDYNVNTKRNGDPPDQRLNSHRVLKLGSLKPNQYMFWGMHDGSQTQYESELSDLNSNSRMSNQRGAFIPNIRPEGGYELHLPSSSLSNSPQDHDAQTDVSGQNLNEQPSILEGLLERAKDRVKERNGLKQDKDLKNQSSRYPPLSPSPYTTPSASDGDQETEGVEKEVKLVRYRASAVSERWKEQLVDEDDDEKRNGVALVDGVNVDWPGWCFDDDEVMNRVGGGGLLEDINRSLNFLYITQLSEQEYGECSQV